MKTVEKFYSAILQGVLEDGTDGYLRYDVCGSSMRELTAMANKQIALWNCPHYKEFRLSRVNETIRREVRTDERTIKNPFKKEKT